MSAKLLLLHPNPRGTGAAMKMELKPADDSGEGGIWMTLAQQTGRSNFDWTNGSMTVWLGFEELTKTLQVFRGECEEAVINIHHTSADTVMTVKLDHRIDPTNCYAMEAIEHRTDRVATDRRVVFLMNSAEALGICEAIASSMGKIAFGEEA